MLDCDLDINYGLLEIEEVAKYVWQRKSVLLVGAYLPGDILNQVSTRVCHAGSGWVICASSGSHMGFQPTAKAWGSNVIPHKASCTEGSVTIMREPNTYMIGRPFDKVFLVHSSNLKEDALLRWCWGGDYRLIHRQC